MYTWRFEYDELMLIGLLIRITAVDKGSPERANAPLTNVWRYVVIFAKSPEILLENLATERKMRRCRNVPSSDPVALQ